MKVNLLILVAAALLVGCSKAIPKSKSDYIGDWHGPQMTLTIRADGRVSYERSEDNSSRSINAPIKEFEGDDFVVGIGPMDTTFVVSVPPHKTDGGWEMVVDGVTLTKK